MSSNVSLNAAILHEHILHHPIIWWTQFANIYNICDTYIYIYIYMSETLRKRLEDPNTKLIEGWMVCATRAPCVLPVLRVWENYVIRVMKIRDGLKQFFHLKLLK